jgi:hypothetical protein
MNLRKLLWVGLIIALAGTPAGSVIIASGNGSGNTTAPADDPGWAHMAGTGGLSAVYIGNGWILTANHVGASNRLGIGGEHYYPITSSKVQLDTNGEPADLAMFRINRDPGLPNLAIRSSTPSLGTDVIMVGLGRNRGDPTSACDPPIAGWLYGPGSLMRWGTNVVEETLLDVGIINTVTRSFYTDFSEQGGTTHESQGVLGDSGGAVFTKQGASWQLAGIQYSRDTHLCQVSTSALYDNLTYIADLAFYRSQILANRAVPACDDGLDDDGDGDIDYPDDRGCGSLDDAFETSDNWPCDDGVDNDGDGDIDYPADIGCSSPTSRPEAPDCSDGVDNDGDGWIDFDGGASQNGGVPLTGDDPQCNDNPARNLEQRVVRCGLGFELALALPVLLALRTRRRSP